MTSQRQDDPYRWTILGLSTLSNVVLAAAPSMALSVLFSEIQRDLHLTLVQVGVIWSIGALFGPPIGNGLAALHPGAPFVFWAALALAGICVLAFASEPTRRPLARAQVEPA